MSGGNLKKIAHDTVAVWWQVKRLYPKKMFRIGSNSDVCFVETARTSVWNEISVKKEAGKTDNYTVNMAARIHGSVFRKRVHAHDEVMSRVSPQS
jgi:hypothetical protein